LCLHFDRKILNNKEHKEVVLKNEFKEVRLSILALPNGQAKTFRLHNDVIHLSAPSQSGIYKAVYREAEKLKLNLKENL
jgi:hypothetical protein